MLLYPLKRLWKALHKAFRDEKSLLGGGKIWYDAGLTDTVKIREWIFSPASVPIREVPLNTAGVAYYKIGIDNFLDALDAGYLAEILRADTSIYGLTTEFACPKCYHPPAKNATT